MEIGIATLRPILGSIAGSLVLGAACSLAPPAADLLARRDSRVGTAHADATDAASSQQRAPERKESDAPDEEESPALLDAWSLAAREDGEACRNALTAAGVKFRALGYKAKPDKSGCGIPHPVLLVRGPTGIVYDPPVTIDCTLARALGSVERIVQEEAETYLHSRIVRIGDLGGYACRPRNYRKGASLSAHAFGSALDVAAFHPAKGTPAIIDRDYDEPKRPSPAGDARRAFLHAVYQRLRRHEADLTYVVGPDFNAIHHNHFHLDRGGWHFWLNR